MGENSKIEWCHHTFNPWLGCTKLSKACDNCYAETLATNRLGVTWGAGAPRRRTAASTWKMPLAWDRKAAKEGRRARVFCASLADVFDAEVSDDWRDDLFALIAATPHLDWLLLTKRPKVGRDYLNRRYGLPAVWLDAVAGLTRSGIIPPSMSACAQALEVCSRLSPSTPLPNVWLGTTVENQKLADLRIPLLLETPAAVRFLSMEPLLGSVDLRDWTYPTSTGRALRAPEPFSIKRSHPVSDVRPGLDWVITGGESGSNARPAHPDWFRSIRDQCAAAGVPFFFKQWGEWHPADQVKNAEQIEAGGDTAHPLREGRAHDFGDQWTWRVGKEPAGRLLDGVIWDQVPAVV